MTPEARTSPVVALCLVLALAAHATECGKPPNHQVSGCADSCSVFEKNLLTRRVRNVRERLALEEAQISLVGQESTDECAKATAADLKADLDNAPSLLSGGVHKN
mmetsp:Transcript_100880/g.200419  ORF Transcript_100880/g.200419 Transcript_100880/m.200419 type:complete len:105 (-) Transcript_100880:28-342(-)